MPAPRLNANDPADVATPYRPEPATDAADLLHLFGRFFMTWMLFLITVVLLFRHQIAVAFVVGTVSLFVQKSALRLWRQMRDERQEKLAARAAFEAKHGLGPAAVATVSAPAEPAEQTEALGR